MREGERFASRKEARSGILRNSSPKKICSASWFFVLLEDAARAWNSPLKLIAKRSQGFPPSKPCLGAFSVRPRRAARSLERLSPGAKSLAEVLSSSPSLFRRLGIRVFFGSKALQVPGEHEKLVRKKLAHRRC